MVDEYAEVFESEGEKHKPKEMETEYKDIHEIINERNKLHEEKKMLVESEDGYKERIGRLNLDLFGDPQNKPDWISRLDKLEEEMDRPMTKTHPISKRVEDVVREIRSLQLEYRGLQRFYDKFVKQIGELLDNSIKMYLTDVESQKKMLAELNVEENLKKSDEKITEYMVNKFMERDGQTLLDRYNQFLSKLESWRIPCFRKLAA